MAAGPARLPTPGAIAPAGAGDACFALLPHTADLRVAFRAPTLESLYAAAVTTVRRLLVGASPVLPAEERLVELPDVPSAERFFRFVRELVYLYDCEGFLPARVLPGSPLRLLGEPFDPARHRAVRQLKALTRHRFALVHDAAGVHVEMLFDV